MVLPIVPRRNPRRRSRHPRHLHPQHLRELLRVRLYVRAAEAILTRHNALPKPTRDVIRTEQREEDIHDMQGYDRKGRRPDRVEARLLEAQQLALAPRERRTCVAPRARRGLVQRRVVPAAAQGVLHDEPPDGRVPFAPCAVELSVEREGGAFVCRVADCEDREEHGPEKERVDGEDGARVEDGAGHPDAEGEEHQRGGERDEYEDIVVGDV